MNESNSGSSEDITSGRERRKLAQNYEKLDKEAKRLFIEYLIEHGNAGETTEEKAESKKLSSDTMMLLIEEASLRDRFTGLYNKEGLHIRTAEALLLAKKHGLSVSILLVDGDRFKRINDTPGLGHGIGDKAIFYTAEGIASLKLRSQDSVAHITDESDAETSQDEARQGGDEFAILVLGADTKGAIEVAKRLIPAVSHSVNTNVPQLRQAFGDDYSYTITVGIASFTPERDLNPNDPEDILFAVDSLINAADQAGIHAKDQKRSQEYNTNQHIGVSQFNPSSNESNYELFAA